MSGRLRVLLASLLAALLCAGCTVTEPSPDDWRSTAQSALEEAASLVATSRLALDTDREDKVWDAYALTLLSDAEKAMSTAVDSVTTLQPPPEVAAETEDVEALLDRAATAVQAVRRTLVGELPIDDELLDGLDGLQETLEKKAAAL